MAAWRRRGGLEPYEKKLLAGMQAPRDSWDAIVSSGGACQSAVADGAFGLGQVRHGFVECEDVGFQGRFLEGTQSAAQPGDLRPHLLDAIPDPGKRVPLRGVVALAAVSDLAAGHTAGVGDDAVESFVRRAPDIGPGRYAASSPAQLLPLGVPQILVHGSADDAVPVTISRDYVAAAKAAGDEVHYHEFADVGHMELIDPGHAAWATAAEAMEALR